MAGDKIFAKSAYERAIIFKRAESRFRCAIAITQNKIRVRILGVYATRQNSQKYYNVLFANL